MFKNLFNLKFKRNVKEAFGFYLVYLFLLIISMMLIAFIVPSNALTYEEGLQEGLVLGAYGAVIICLILPLVMLIQKKIFNASFLLVLLGGALAAIGGGLLGLIPSAIISTFNSKDEKEEMSNETGDQNDDHKLPY